MADKLELGPRLRAIAALVPENCSCLADIGTDHGYIPVSLLLERKVRGAVSRISPMMVSFVMVTIGKYLRNFLSACGRWVRRFYFSGS